MQSGVPVVERDGAIDRGTAESIRAVIWFSDLRGFTRLTDRLPRDVLIAMLDDYLEAMARPVQDNRGQILKFLGDGLLAYFGYPQAHEDEIAVHAAREPERQRVLEEPALI